MAEKTIQIEDMITVGDLAEKLDIPVTELITVLIKNGVMATVNERLDFETAEIVVGEMEGEIKLEKSDKKVADVAERKKRELTDKAVERPPVVAVMGHVDHGKTSLLDAIRESDVVEGEAGGITQHISAYQITHNKRKITFLDTPGHEAFAALREHGAQLTDVAIIVVAADDGIKPQTKEAIRYAQKAGVKIVVAINKVDVPGANINQVKQQLSDEKLLIEEWGGDTIAVEVSAKQKTNIDKLLDMVLLVADVEELKAEKDTMAEGLIIEAHMEKGRGAVATALVEHGFLSPGDFIAVGAAHAKIRTLQDSNGRDIEEAGPSTPVIITGFKNLPRFGDIFHEFETEKLAKAAAEKARREGKDSDSSGDMTSGELLSLIDRKLEQQHFNVLIRADVQGSLKSVIDALKTMEHKEVKARVIGKGVGNISENDVRMAASSEAVIYGFNVEVSTSVKKLAAREGVKLQIYKVIYELIDDVKDSMSEMLADEVVETEMGRLIVKGVFRITQKQLICGGEVSKGKIKPGAFAKIMRDEEELGIVEVETVQKNQSDVKEVKQGDMCGLQLRTEGKINLKEEDRLEIFTREVKARNL